MRLMLQLYPKVTLPCSRRKVNKYGVSSLGRANEGAKYMNEEEAMDLIERTKGSRGDIWTDLREFFNRPWWSRIWVHQEATADCRKGPLLMCGPHTVNFDVAIHSGKIICSLMKRHSIPGELGRDTLPYMGHYFLLRQEYNQTGTIEFLRLYDLLSALRSYEATDARDKLYALVPLSLDGADILEIDYHASTEDVYCNAATNFIRHFRTLDILTHCCKSRNLSAASLLDLPSWVPDWTLRWVPDHFLKRGMIDDKNEKPPRVERIGKLYNASLETQPDLNIVDSTSRKLLARGFHFDVVKHVSPHANASSDHKAIAEDWMHWLNENNFTLSRESGSYPGSVPSSSLDAFQATLVADSRACGIDVGRRGCRASLADIPAFAHLHVSEEDTPALATTIPPAADTTSDADLPEMPFFIAQYGPLHKSTKGRTLILTANGYLGLTAAHVQVGDVVVILFGGQMPFVLHRVVVDEDNDIDEHAKHAAEFREGRYHYQLIGEAYLHGIMDGEAMHDKRLRAADDNEPATIIFEIH